MCLDCPFWGLWPRGFVCAVVTDGPRSSHMVQTAHMSRETLTPHWAPCKLLRG